MRKPVSSTILLIVISFVFSCCTPKERGTVTEGSQITILSIGDERVLGPMYDSSPRFLVFLPMVEHSFQESKPALAESWEYSPDYTKWTFYLHKNIKWHDGTPTTARDIEFTFDLLDEVAQVKKALGLESYAAIDDFTFTLTFNKPSLYALDYWSVFWPKHLLEDLDPKEIMDWEFWTRPVGNGPYRYVRHVPKTMIELEANPDYYKEKPKIQKVILKFGGTSPLTELLSGNVDVVPAGLSDVPKLRDDPRFRVYYKKTWFVGAVFWNHRHPLFKEPAVRRALTMGIDRRELARLLYYPDDVVLFDGLSTTPQHFADDLPGAISFDLRKAERILEDAGWIDRDGNGVREKDGREFRFTAIFDKTIGLDLDKAAVFVQDQLKRLEIRMDIQELQGTLNTRFRSGDFEAVFGKFQNSPVASAGQRSVLGENSPLGYENADMIRLLNQARNEPDLEKQKSIYETINPIYAADVPMTILFPETKTLIAHKRVRGLEVEEYSDPAWFMQYLWIEEE